MHICILEPMLPCQEIKSHALFLFRKKKKLNAVSIFE